MVGDRVGSGQEIVVGGAPTTGSSAAARHQRMSSSARAVAQVDRLVVEDERALVFGLFARRLRRRASRRRGSHAFFGAEDADSSTGERSSSYRSLTCSSPSHVLDRRRLDGHSSAPSVPAAARSGGGNQPPDQTSSSSFSLWPDIVSISATHVVRQLLQLLLDAVEVVARELAVLLEMLELWRTLAADVADGDSRRLPPASSRPSRAACAARR